MHEEKISPQEGIQVWQQPLSEDVQGCGGECVVWGWCCVALTHQPGCVPIPRAAAICGCSPQWGWTVQGPGSVLRALGSLSPRCLELLLSNIPPAAPSLLLGLSRLGCGFYTAGLPSCESFFPLLAQLLAGSMFFFPGYGERSW